MQKNCFSYPVEFVDDVFGESPVLADVLKKVANSETPRVLIVADLNVVQRNEGLGSKIGRYVQAHGICLAGSPVVIAGGEKAKADNLQSALKVVSAILSSRLGRNDVVLALGGGSVLDVAGYAAAQTRGGVRIVRLPTTPAAMTDAAFAAFAAVDLATVKDALQVSSVPAAVIIDSTFAASVLDGVWRGGISEAVRLAVASDASLLRKIVKLAPAFRNRDGDALRELLEASAATRGKKGPTKWGLWSALRLESMSGYKLPHGYAVAIGLCLDLGYSVEKGLMKADDRDKVVRLLDACGALDGLNHSGHLLSQTDSLLCGLDAWALASGSAALPVSAGIGKLKEELAPDREAFLRVIGDLDSFPRGA